jgi:hypothetical protein
MKNFALGALVSLLVAAAGLQALGQSDDAQREPPASADSPSASPDVCKAEIITAIGRSKFRPLSKTKELEGKGDAMADAVATWEREVSELFGQGWKHWTKATDKSFNCVSSQGKILSGGVACTVSGRPCGSATAAADKSDLGPLTPTAQTDEEQAASDDCHGIIVAVGGLATSKRQARRAAENTWMNRIMLDFGERYVDLNFAQEVSHVCAVAIPISPSIVIKKVYFRCKIWARPCRPAEGAMAKIELRYDEEEPEN